MLLSIQSRRFCKLKILTRLKRHVSGSVGFVGIVVVVVDTGPIVVVGVGPVVVVVVGQSTVKLGPQRFQPPEKELGVVEVLYLHLTFCPLGTFTDPLSELPGGTDRLETSVDQFFPPSREYSAKK